MPEDSGSLNYRVLARKYRPVNLEELRGQDVLVRTLRHAVESDRIAQAFLFTGVRGVGKTTTARILAKMMNCIGVDGRGGVTAQPCNACEQCTAITEDRHIDVLEIDAASHTGIDNIRELLEHAHYRPVLGRYKIYILDEVHMLSTSAFNALLKTLEEPPEHLKFVFATTELRKIPATILSRCQRFDLRRIDARELADHFREVAGKEGASASDEALALVARAADGSARDGLSILDQAISQGRGSVTVEHVRDMLGLADRGRIVDLHEKVMHGKIADALSDFDDLYASGVNPATVLEDLLEFTHWMTRYKAAPDAASRDTPEFERVHGSEMAKHVRVPQLTRAWQILLKGIREISVAPDGRQVAEMTLVRLAYSANLPTPEQALKILEKPDSSQAGTSSTSPKGAPKQDAEARQPAPVVVDKSKAPRTPPPSNLPGSFAELLNQVEGQISPIVCTYLRTALHLVSYSPGSIVFRAGRDAPASFARDLARELSSWSGHDWQIGTSRENGQPTIAEQEKALRQKRLEEASAEPGVARILERFPGAKIVDVREPGDGNS